MNEQNQFDWVDFYKEFASKLLDYKDRRDELVLHQLLAQGGFILQARFAQLQIRGGICLPFLKAVR